ncbi:hypothetical protein GGR51DRAFT_556536 [Nemania sp. FL0031]|nr:hypothetical protein GGR51DRAFT_556536 [Nemania sp. FL0031]
MSSETSNSNIAAIKELFGATRRKFKAINDLCDETRRRIENLRLRIDDIDYNNRARIRNGAIPAGSEVHPYPLVNIDTHQFVWLPDRVEKIKALDDAEVQYYLWELGQIPLNSAENRKTQLEEFLGIISPNVSA